MPVWKATIRTIESYVGTNYTHTHANGNFSNINNNDHFCVLTLLTTVNVVVKKQYVLTTWSGIPPPVMHRMCSPMYCLCISEEWIEKYQQQKNHMNISKLWTISYNKLSYWYSLSNVGTQFYVSICDQNRVKRTDVIGFFDISQNPLITQKFGIIFFTWMWQVPHIWEAIRMSLGNEI